MEDNEYPIWKWMTRRNSKHPYEMSEWLSKWQSWQAGLSQSKCDNNDIRWCLYFIVFHVEMKTIDNKYSLQIQKGY